MSTFTGSGFLDLGLCAFSCSIGSLVSGAFSVCQLCRNPDSMEVAWFGIFARLTYYNNILFFATPGLSFFVTAQ